MYEQDGPMWVKMVDAEGEAVAEVVAEEDDDILDDDDGTAHGDVVLDQGSLPNQGIVLSHPRRRNHGNNHKKTPPMTPSKVACESSACLERRIDQVDQQ
jgi:hypothetical protein